MAKGTNPGVKIPGPGEASVGVRTAIQQIVTKIGMLSQPVYSGLTLSGLTASRLLSTDASKALASADLASWVTGTANEINIADDGDGTITIGIVDPLIVSKGGTGMNSLTNHSLLVGSGTDPITAIGVATNGQLPIGSTGADPVLATITGTADQIAVANAAGSITLSLTGNMDEIAALTPTDGNIMVGNGATWIAESGATARASLGLTIGTHVQAWDTDLDSIAALSGADSNFIVGSATGWVAESGATVRASLGLTIGTDVQAFGAVLDDLNTLGTAASDGQFIVATGAGAFAYESSDIARISLGVGTTDSPQFTGIELGHATDTTITRVGPGSIAVEGVNVMLQGDAPTAHLHDTDVLQCDGINSDGGAFSFTTSGLVTFSESITMSAGKDLTIAGHIIFNTDLSYIGFVSPRITFNDTDNTLDVTGSITMLDDATIGLADGTASILFDDTLNKVKVTGTLVQEAGDIRSGVDDTTRGFFRAYGSSGSDYGGSFISYVSADEDDTIESYMFTSHDDDCYVCYAAGVGSIITVTGPACGVSISTTLGVTGAITASNYTAANLLTACATNAGALDFSAAAKTLTVEDDAIVSQDYSSDASPQFSYLTLTDMKLLDGDTNPFLEVDTVNLNVRLGSETGERLGNVCVGVQAGTTMGGTGTEGSNQVLIGYLSGYGGIGGNRGQQLVGVGGSTLRDVTTGIADIALGSDACRYLTTASNVVCIGYRAGRYNETGDSNVYIGSSSGEGATGQNNSENTGIGTSTFTSITTGSYNTAIGRNAGRRFTTGASNVCIGYQAGARQTTNSNLLIIDNQDRASAANELSSAILYGVFHATGTSQTLRCNGKFGVNTTPSEEIHAADTIRADTFFNHDGIDGVTDTDAGVITDIDVSGGIVTAITKSAITHQTIFNFPASSLIGDNDAQLVAGDVAASPTVHKGRPVLAFDATDEEAALTPCVVMPQGINRYGTTLYATISFYMATDNTNDIALDVFVEAVTPNSDTLDLEAATGWDTANSGTISLGGSTAGDLKILTITLANKDSVASGDLVRFGIRRDCDSGNDDASGDLYIVALEIWEA